MSELLDLVSVISKLLNCESILLLCHKNPDGDTLGSASALYWALEKLGKTVGILCADAIPERYDFMGISLFKDEFDPQYIVAIDVAGVQLFGETLSKYIKNVDMCIDHHPSNSGYADCMLLDGEAAATAEIIYDVINALGVEITPQIADCLYTGISTDTGCFKFGNTTARTHTIAAALMQAGANTIELNSILFESKSRRRLDIEKTALENMAFYFDNRCALTFLTREEIAAAGADGTDLEGITSIPRTIEGVKVGITMRQLETGSYKISVRTTHDVNATEICSHLGGGGHKQASGCEIIGGLENSKAAILAEVKKVLCKE
ncbi:MAG: bifunctional oligoribonuclease/PAP phosphatase NrnA [Oscillospiraceae bacterium]